MYHFCFTSYIHCNITKFVCVSISIPIQHLRKHNYDLVYHTEYTPIGHNGI